MNLRNDIYASYVDVDGLVAPNPCSNTAHNASNNGICYSGEYITLMALTNQILFSDCINFNHVMKACEAAPGCFNRSPANTRDYEAPDDYYGLLCGLYFSKMFMLSRDILEYGFKNYGSFNNLNPGHFQWSTMFWRQLDILALNLWSAYPNSKLVKTLMLPITVITAIIIATSCIGLQQSDGADPWRLTYLVVQVAKRESWLCKMASKFWFKRLDAIWGGMSFVYAQYYKGISGREHPFTEAMRILEKNGKT